MFRAAATCPREVEEVLIAHPDVDNVVVLGIPDEYWGEAVHAVVVPTAGAKVGGDELIAYCAESLAGYKKPKAVEFVESLPVSAYGRCFVARSATSTGPGMSERSAAGREQTQRLICRCIQREMEDRS